LNGFIAFFNTTYGFTPGIGGLVYLGLGIGFFSATIFGAKFADGIYKKVRIFAQSYVYHILTDYFLSCPKRTTVKEHQK